MRCRILQGAAVIAVVSACDARQVSAQPAVGTTDIGAVIGVGNVAGSSLAVGARFETIVRTLPQAANGTLGVQVSVDTYSWSAPFWGYRATPIGVAATYHAPVHTKRADLFGGVGLGYTQWKCSMRLTTTSRCGYDSGLSLFARVGARYVVKPDLSLYAEMSSMGASLNLGAMYTLK